VSVSQFFVVKIFLMKWPCFWNKSFRACPLKTTEHTVWTFQEGCTWEEIWSVEILSWSRRLRFVKWLGTRLLACWDQHTCCTKVFVNGVVNNFYPMGTKVHMNYELQCSRWNQMFNLDWLVCRHNAAFNERNWKW
jgi:hypothetical protein